MSDAPEGQGDGTNLFVERICSKGRQGRHPPAQVVLVNLRGETLGRHAACNLGRRTSRPRYGYEVHPLRIVARPVPR